MRYLDIIAESTPVLTKTRSGVLTGVIIGGVVFAVVVLAVFLIVRSARKNKSPDTPPGKQNSDE